MVHNNKIVALYKVFSETVLKYGEINFQEKHEYTLNTV